MLNFVLCDDNIKILNRLSKLLESIFINYNIEATVGLETTKPEAVLSYIDSNKVDVLILDINLKSKMNGCDIADIVRKKNKKVYIIFTTGHLEYALLAYKYKTFDYLPKPVSEERLEETVLRLVEDINYSPARFLKLNNNNTIINQDEVNYIRKDGMKLVFCTNTRNYEMYSSFNKIKSCLPDNFVRCHKSYIVNIEKITDVESRKNVILFKHDEQCAIGAKYKKAFEEKFDQRFFATDADTNKNVLT